jgi:uncharacterized membrane protein
MADIESLLNRWQSAGVLDADTAGRIRGYEADRDPASVLPVVEQQVNVARIGWQGRVALILGGILLTSGVVLFVSAHWDQLSTTWRYVLVMTMVAVFHIGGSIARDKFHGLSTTLHAIGTVSTGAAIALVGQIFNIQEHWPAGILLWAVAAVFGWILLRDEAQQTLALLLVPSWLISEWAFPAEPHIGSGIYFGRFLIVWATLYFTVFLGSSHKVVRGILFAISAIASVVGIVMMLESWTSWSATQSFLPVHMRFWGWVVIAAIPLFASLIRLRRSTIPVLVSVAFVILLPWCTRTWTQYYNYGANHGSYTRSAPGIASHALIACFCVFFIWWGVSQSSRALVNLGIVSFGVTVAWFYFSDLFDMMGRSLGLIGLGVLFLAGGWALEKMRRGLLTRMEQSNLPTLKTDAAESKGGQ